MTSENGRTEFKPLKRQRAPSAGRSLAPISPAPPAQQPYSPPLDSDDVPRIGLRREAAAKAIDVSLGKLDALTKAGEIPVVKLGGTVLFPVSGLVAWLDRLGQKSLRRARGGS